MALVHKSLGKRIRQLRASSLLDSRGFVPLLLLPPSVTLAEVVTRTSLCDDCRAVRVSLPEPVRGLLFFGGGDEALVHTYLHIRILGAGRYQVQKNVLTPV